jgi:predicted dithiol-disulfide oxidoreductase (DUF899 family)
MALKGSPRDMNKWREVLLDPKLHFPGESSEYRSARNELLESEAELRGLNEKVAAQRRALPAGGLIKEDYVFESAGNGSQVRFSELFAPGKNSLVIYNMMFPRWSQDPRAGAPGGKTAQLPLVEQPCPSCTSVVDGLEGAAFHLAERINLVVIAKASPDRLGTYAQEHRVNARWHLAWRAAYGPTTDLTSSGGEDGHGQTTQEFCWHGNGSRGSAWSRRASPRSVASASPTATRSPGFSSARQALSDLLEQPPTCHRDQNEPGPARSAASSGTSAPGGDPSSSIAATGRRR